jgi:hypothetical protein
MTSTVLDILADTSIRALLAAALVASALSALRVRASAPRHASWTAVLIAMLLMPVLSYYVPAIRLPFTVTVPAAVREAASKIVLETASHEVRAIEAALDARRSPSANPIAERPDKAGEPAPNHAYLSAPVNRQPPLSSRLLTLLATYYVVAAVMLIRFFVGWWSAAQITLAGKAVSLRDEDLALLRSPNRVEIRESTLIAAPVTVGALVPTILLPVTWSGPARKFGPCSPTNWPISSAETSSSRSWLISTAVCFGFILSHGGSSARWRRRPNKPATTRPWPWWARVCNMRRSCSIWRAVSQRRSRISWQGVGIDGSGLLHQRIERALNSNVLQKTSAVRKGVLAISCGTAILFASACQPSSASLRASAALEERDRKLRAELVEIGSRQFQDLANVNWDAGAGSLESLAAKVETNPEDLTTLQQFLVSYWVGYGCQPAAGCGNPLVATKVVDRKLLAVRRAHILWLIEHHPDSELAGAVEARIFPNDLQPFFPGDQEGYLQAKALWVTQANRSAVRAIVLGNAADFLEVADKPLAEEMLLRARVLEPNGPWMARLGRHYAIALVGSNGRAGRNVSRTLSIGEPRSSYGQTVRRTLAESTDEVLLTAAGWFLARSGGSRPGNDFDPRLFAQSCFTRALEINPAAVLAHSALRRAPAADMDH